MGTRCSNLNGWEDYENQTQEHRKHANLSHLVFGLKRKKKALCITDAKGMSLKQCSINNAYS